MAVLHSSFARRLILQIASALSQVAILICFVTYLPGLSDDPTGWAARYFVALAVVSPIYVFFGFELRKITASYDGADAGLLHRKRLLGLALATVASLLVLVLGLPFGLRGGGAVFLVVVLFRIVMGLHDQFLADFERQDRFGAAAISSLLKAVAFVLVAMLVPLAASAAGVRAGADGTALLATLSMLVIVYLYDIRRGTGIELSSTIMLTSAERSNWPTYSSITREDWLTGLGSFLVSMTMNAPRLLAAILVGELAVVLLGVGQSLNRCGQIMSGGLTQMLLVLRRRSGFGTGRFLLAAVAVQCAIFASMTLSLPIWKIAFPYVSGAQLFETALVLLFFFGLLSQTNYLLQSLRLVEGRVTDFVKSPVVFYVAFFLGIIFWSAIPDMTTNSEILGYLIVIIGARTAQLLFNARWASTARDGAEE